MKFIPTTRQATRALMLLMVGGIACMGAQVRAADVLATLSQVQGGVMVKQRDGTPRILGAGATIAVGDTVTTPSNAFARIRVLGGADITLKPGTRVSVERLAATSGTAGSPMVVLALQKGGISVDASTGQDGRKVNVLLRTEFGDVTMQGANAFIALMEATTEAQLAARRAYLLSSTASLDMPRLTGVRTDNPAAVMPSFQLAQLNTDPKAPGLPAGLYVSVIDGAINLSNKGGSQSFTAGQFGYTANVTKPPVVVPANPGIKFTPPPTFSSNSGQGSGAGGSKAAAIDCVVR